MGLPVLPRLEKISCFLYQLIQNTFKFLVRFLFLPMCYMLIVSWVLYCIEAIFKYVHFLFQRCFLLFLFQTFCSISSVSFFFFRSTIFYFFKDRVSFCSPSLEHSGMISAHCNLRLLSSSDSRASASGITGACHPTWLIFVFLVEMSFLHVGQADLELLISSDPPTSASQSVGITGVSHCAWPKSKAFNKACMFWIVSWSESRCFPKRQAEEEMLDKCPGINVSKEMAWWSKSKLSGCSCDIMCWE